ncbi:MAG: hypothetical protein H7834_01820 [Magnetococcus sp. YQC-9]
MNKTLEEMLTFIEARRIEEREKILGAARREAARLLAEAHGKARVRVQEMVARERRVRDQALLGARVRVEIERRNHRMRVVGRRLEQERKLLEDALLARWQDPAARCVWLAACIERARGLFPADDWELVHPLELAEGDLAFLDERLRAAGVQRWVGRADATLTAGIRIGCGGAWIDGGIAGLLTDGLKIDAQLLAWMQIGGEAG